MAQPGRGRLAGPSARQMLSEVTQGVVRCSVRNSVRSDEEVVVDGRGILCDISCVDYDDNWLQVIGGQGRR